ncbi:MAG: hypothetical protein J6S85_12510 [Methanobrevibacter sp.]|nr:hypothetical protein [Methanobrevibacter sp.]
MTNLEKYIDALCGEGKVWKDKDRDWLKKSIFEVVELSDGRLYALDKSHMDTHFCFSFDEVMDCQSGTHTYQEANDRASNVQYDYFLQENIKELLRDVDVLENEKDLYICKHYYKGTDNIVGYCGWKNNDTVRELTDDDRQRIIDAKKRQIENKTKRCATYWKKYGKEKLHTWTYSCWD